MIRITIFLLLLIIAGCSTNPPDPFEDNISNGKIFISSDVEGAEIFIDNTSTGKYTPDTVTAASGSRLLSLRKSGYINKDTTIVVVENLILTFIFSLQQIQLSRLVLIEDFANVSCNPCVASNKILHSLDSYEYKDRIAVIKYPTWWPGANDPFYLAAKTESDKRIGYYNINLAPTVVVDGTGRPSPFDSLRIKEYLNEHLAVNPRFGITVTYNISGENLHTEVSVTSIDTAGLKFNDLVLHTVVIETEIEFSSPPGSNGETKFYHVMRSMLPSADGEQLTAGDNVYHRNVICKSVWNKSRLKVAAFIQNKTTKEIIQTGINL
jgi:hypothetical protein